MVKEIKNVFCLKGATEICDYVKEDPRQIIELVRQEGLPAFRRGPNGCWRALNVDLENWMVQQRNKYLKETLKNLP